MAMNRIFRCFRMIQVSIGPASASRGVADSPYRLVGESALEFLKEVQIVKWKAVAPLKLTFKKY